MVNLQREQWWAHMINCKKAYSIKLRDYHLNQQHCSVVLTIIVACITPKQIIHNTNEPSANNQKKLAKTVIKGNMPVKGLLLIRFNHRNEITNWKKSNKLRHHKMSRSSRNVVIMIIQYRNLHNMLFCILNSKRYRGCRNWQALKKISLIIWVKKRWIGFCVRL